MAPPSNKEHAIHSSGAPKPEGYAQRLVHALRLRVASSIAPLTGGGGSSKLDYSSPAGDPGLFGPDSVCWKVHADFAPMMAGGISALLLQTLHPLALAGVWDHSTFREDMLGRLRRTARFIAGTTYGNRADALAQIERVRQLHITVTGTSPDHRPYRADDPALLTWVHVAEMSSFLASYLRYVNPALPVAMQDQYYDETARIALMLGATEVPRSRAAIDAYLHMMRAELQAGERTREVVRLLLQTPAPRAAMRPAATLMRHAGIDLLPPWARRMHGLERFSGVRHLLVQSGMSIVTPALRWALVNGVAARARQRANAPPAMAVDP